MKNLKNNLSKNNNNSVNRKTYMKAISLASLSSLFMSLAVNDIQKANATVGPVPVPKIFYGSNGARTITGVHNGNSGVKALPNPGNITTTSKGSVITTSGNPGIKKSLSLSLGNINSGKTSISTQTKSGIGTQNKTASIASGTTGVKTFKNAGTQTKNTINGSVFHGSLNTIESASTISNATSNKTSKSTGVGSATSGSIKSSTKQSVVTSNTGTNKDSSKLSKKQKLALSAGVAGLATLGLGLGLGLGLKDNGDNPKNRVTPPDTVPTPDAPPVYSTLITQSSDGNLFVDEKVEE